ncbi:MAG TPA: helix-turn-helix domain-containing protein [Anaeromyxobacteraceae bacterium]|nr:helix-turn-helix domain-containing protein [Anaeromyxobacteraceae bacterium]
MRALLLAEAPSPLLRACQASGCEVTRVRTVAEGRAVLSRSRARFDLVDGRIAHPPPLDEEIQERLDLFFERLGGHPSGGLYQAVMREVERPLVSGALARARGVRSAAARALGIDRGTLARRLKALGLHR